MAKQEYHKEETIKALNKIAVKYGVQMAKTIEKIIRCETAHLTSKQWQLCKCAGMEMGKWSNLDEHKFTLLQMNDNHLQGEKKLRTFIVWNDVYDFCEYLAEYINRHNGNFARWNSLNLERQESYRKKVLSVKNRLI